MRFVFCNEATITCFKSKGSSVWTSITSQLIPNVAKVVVASKIRPEKMHPKDVRQECEESLARLQTDYLDLYQSHWTNPDIPLADTWGAMCELQEAGLVRHIGVCNAGVEDLADICATQTPLSNQVPYNLVARMIEWEIQPACVERGIGILVYSPLMHGMLADKYTKPSDVPDGRARSRHFPATMSVVAADFQCQQKTISLAQP